MRDLDLVVFGGVGIDTIVRVPALPLPMADSIHVPAVRDYVAHTGNGVALGSHALGRVTKVVDFIGDDPQAALIHARYRERGLDFTYIVHASGTRRSVNLVDQSGRRLSLYDGRHPDDLRLEREVYLPLLQRTQHAHFSIMPWARHLYDDAQALDVTISTDLHDWDGIKPYYHDFALRSDVVFMSTAAMGSRYEDIMRGILRDGRAQVVVATGGAQGSWYMTRAQQMLVHQPCVNLGVPIVDSNGAGDAFSSAFLAGFAQDLPLTQCMRMGAIAGEYACGFEGTAESFLTRAALDQLLRQTP
jgi:sugar/nucleoside kinase (ribokinase family)